MGEGAGVGWPETLRASARTLEFVLRANGTSGGCCTGLPPGPGIPLLRFACPPKKGRVCLPAPPRQDSALGCAEVWKVPAQRTRRCPVSHWPEEAEGTLGTSGAQAAEPSPARWRAGPLPSDARWEPFSNQARSQGRLPDRMPWTKPADI